MLGFLRFHRSKPVSGGQVTVVLVALGGREEHLDLFEEGVYGPKEVGDSR